MVLLALTVFAIGLLIVPQLRKKREEAFQE
jgi:hypothetical protein